MQELTNYSYGSTCFEEMPGVLAAYGFDSVILIGGEKALAAAEFGIRQALGQSSIQIKGSFVYGKAATQDAIDRLVVKKEVQEAHVIIGVGGGQALDTAKMVAKESGKDILTVPTICSTCAASTGLAVIYQPDHSLAYYGKPPVPLHTFLNTDIIAKAPNKYFWAGVGDGISKGPEVTRAIREDEQKGVSPSHAAVLGRAIAQSSQASLFQHAEAGLEAVRSNKATHPVEEVMLAIIISTAYASNLVNQATFDYTACHAHAFYNGTTAVKREGEYLHGAVVAFGVMVLHAYFEETEELERVADFNHRLGLPTTLAAIGLTVRDIPTIVAFSEKTNEYRHTPYDLERFDQAIRIADALGRKYES